MTVHIVLMNLVMPVVAYALQAHFPHRTAILWRSWPVATALQLILLWGWHAPPVLAAAMGNAPLMALMHVTLIVSAGWFWSAVFAVPASGLWRAIFALLVTGKLFCLLGALLVFAPRQIYSGMAYSVVGGGLADQQLAGLLMVIACPLSYVVVGVAVTARWFLALEAQAQ